MDLGAEEELSSEPSELQELARAQDENFARLARTFQSGMESLATTLSEAFHSFKRQNLGEDKVINEDRGNDSVDEELHRGKGECEPQKTCQGKGQSCKRKFDVADEGSDSSDEEGKTSFGFKKSCARTGTSTVTKGDTGSDPDRNEDSLSLGGHDSLDEDINKLIDPPDKEAEGKEGDILDEISVQHVAAEKLGKSINNKVAGIVNSLFANKQKEDKINKMEFDKINYGVCDRNLSWFQSYLSNRKQFCRVNGIDSETERIEVGVPQGSCLGPLLFLVYINDLPCAVKNSTTSMYADDTTLFFRSKNIEDLNEAINSDLRDLDSWLSGNKLSLNVAKTQGMLICTKNKQRSLECTSESLCLKIRDNDLALVEKTKYLGVQVDNSLDWKEHIKSVSAKVSRAVGLLKYAKRFLPQNSLKTLYTSIVEPHFRYCCAVWGCCSTTEISKLQKLQNRAARIITNSSFDASSKPLIQNLGWKTVNDMIKHESRTMVYKSINNIAPPYMNDMFTRNSQDATRQLRNTNTDLKLPKKRTCNGQKSFSFRGAKLWNSLDTEAKRATSLNRFKSLI